ncbi:MAG: hypothetical protein Q7U40_04700 [Desulfatirhabdiaceae bacterium]|nr:hypothetical protein [Desulfatirhabdiaceae bacterium]
MELWIDALIVLLILTNLKLIGSSRLSACIHIVALQGILLGILPGLVVSGQMTLRAIVLSAMTIVLKGIVFPWLLLRSMRTTAVSREMEPFIGYSTSMLVSVGLLALAIWMGTQLPLPIPLKSPLVVPLSLFTIMVGLLAIVSRRKALSQVLGYLVMENGIYAFGLALALKEPLLVELGTLLDVFMGVFVMGIAIFHINREFDHIDTDLLSTLKG